MFPKQFVYALGHDFLGPVETWRPTFMKIKLLWKVSFLDWKIVVFE